MLLSTTVPTREPVRR